MPTPKKPKVFHEVDLIPEKNGDDFFPEYTIVVKTVEAVNSLHSLYRKERKGTKGGPSTHAQQDLCRSMLVFACAGLDVLVKKLIGSKIGKVLSFDETAKEKFAEFVRRGADKDPKGFSGILSVALIAENPRDFLIKDYVGELTSGSLQSIEELNKASQASGLDTHTLLPKEKNLALKAAFEVRNQIIHEMDIDVGSSKQKTAYRTRRQRQIPVMDRHTRTVLVFLEDFFEAYKDKLAKAPGTYVVSV